jgi:hypothetical protein
MSLSDYSETEDNLYEEDNEDEQLNTKERIIKNEENKEHIEQKEQEEYNIFYEKVFKMKNELQEYSNKMGTKLGNKLNMDNLINFIVSFSD